MSLVALLGLAQPLVSKHLRVLREVGLVEVRGGLTPLTRPCNAGHHRRLWQVSSGHGGE